MGAESGAQSVAARFAARARDRLGGVVPGEASEIMHHPDPPSVVIDEIVAMPLVLIGLGSRWWCIVVGFAMFRLFDIWKPSPVREAQNFTGGIGIVLDDLLAATYACMATHGIVWLVSWMKHRGW